MKQRLIKTAIKHNFSLFTFFFLFNFYTAKHLVMCAMNKTKQKQKTQQNLVRLSIKKTIKRQNSKIIRRPSPGV